MIDNKKCGLRETSLLFVVFLPLVFAKTLKCGIIGLSGENLDRYQPNYSLIAATFNLSLSRRPQRVSCTCVTCHEKQLKINSESLKIMKFETFKMVWVDKKKRERLNFPLKKSSLETLKNIFFTQHVHQDKTWKSSSCILSTKRDLHICLFKLFSFHFVLPFC